jgi:CheY-like chemotaxis protein
MNDTISKGKVLLVDDDKFLADMYGMKFDKENYTAQACLSVNDALTVLHGGFVPDVILFDLTMPERDGFSFLQALREEKLAESAIKIALTNQSDDAEKQKAAELGATRYIVKASMIPSEVVNTVAEEMAKRKGVS